MAEQIEQEKLFNPDFKNQERETAIGLSESRKELDNKPRIAIFPSGTKVFLKDQDSENMLSYEIPEGRELEALFLGKVNKEDGKASCVVNELFIKTEKGEYKNDLHQLILKGRKPAFIKRGNRIWLDSNDLIKQLDLKLQKEEIERNRIEQEKKDSKILSSDHFKKIGVNWGKKYRDPTHVKGIDD